MAIKPPKGYKKGKAISLIKCCREIRICSPNKLGQISEGFNPFGSQQNHQKIMVIKESKPFDMSKTIVVILKKI